MIKNKFIYLLLFAVFFSLVIGLYLGEDSIGSGKHDYTHHLVFLNGFSENFFEAYKKFGTIGGDNVRNSPIFYMFFSFFLKIGLPIETLKIINLVILIPLLIFFIKCLEIKFPKIDTEPKIYLLSALLLSPTIRTLLVWPYPLLWAICFFLISIYFFLIFEKTENLNKKMIFVYANIFFLSLSAYFTPKFCVFSLFFFYNFFQYFRFKKEIFKIILLNLLLATPAIYFLITKDFYLFISEPFDVDISTKYNFSNKIIIISSMFFLFFLPFISRENFLNNIKPFFKMNYVFFSILFFIAINIYFYDFFSRTGSGGGIFFHLSQILFKDSSLLFIVFVISLFLFKYLDLLNFNNIFLFMLSALYNLEYTIYFKYFDPLIFFLLLFLIKYKENSFIDIKKLSKKVFLFYVFFLFLNFSKSFITY